MEIGNQQAVDLNKCYIDDIIKYENVENTILNNKLSKEENEQIIYDIDKGYKFLKDNYGLSRDQVKRMKNKLYNQYETNIPSGFEECILDENYLVGQNGVVLNKRKRTTLKPLITKKGYCEFDGVDKRISIHRCVAITYLDNPENKETVNHIDGIKTNNAVNNLEWNTIAENNEHKKINGLGRTNKAKLAATGSNNTQSKISEKDVIEIRNSILSKNELGNKFNISIATINDILARRSWKHI